MKPPFLLSSHLPTVITLFFLLNLSLLLSSSSSSSAPSLQLLSLLSLKSSVNDPLGTLHDWKPTQIPSKPNADGDDDDDQHSDNRRPAWCLWSGIECDHETAQVTSVDLSSRNLSGSIPAEIRHLKRLTHLNLSRNSFDGPFPDSVFELVELRSLDINHNNFNSTFPAGISKLKSLRFFSCYSNCFTGPLPEDFSGHESLEYLNLGGSYFEGPIPPDYGDLPKLTFLYLAGNMINGSIPSQLGQLAELKRVEIGYNANLSGSIPPELGKLSKIEYMDISNSNLSGSIPPEIGNLTMVQTLFLFKNQLSGSIPPTISKMGRLSILDLSDNQLTGEIPVGISLLKELTLVSLMDNNLTGEIPPGIGDLPNLEILHLWNNSLVGSLPPSLGSNGNLQKLDVSSNKLTGPLPENLCRGNKLVKLLLFSNRFTSELPSSLANCTTLSRVRVQENHLHGSIPPGFGNLPNLTFLDLSRNNFTGPVPIDLPNSPNLGTLNLSENSFNGELPRNIWKTGNLQIFSAAKSNLTGKLPDFIGCQSIYEIELSGNSLTGSISWDIGDCEKLVTLDLGGNSLTGIIPWEISALPAITAVDLSHNKLNGSIPSSFNNCSTLEIFNVSFNLLTGSIPSSGPVFSNLHPSSFAGNPGLCGELVGRPCDSPPAAAGDPDPRRTETKRTAGAIVWITAAAFGVGLFVLFAGIRCFQNESVRAGGRRFGGGDSTGPWKLTAFQRLSFTAEDVLDCLAMSDKVVGMGSTGTVYRAEMPGGEIIAVKKLWGKQKETATTRQWQGGVLAEVDVLGNVRHRNIVRLLGCCSNRETTMLLYEYMPNGSLDDLLHGRNKGENHLAPADWLIRYKIALGVAQGISYLHHDCNPLIVHRDLKPSNILLDEEMEARVADFGVAKLIQSNELMSVIAGSYGYIAPEYAYTLQVDGKSDIYSFGVVLLEILTGKRSVDPEFGDGNSIVDWVKAKIKSKDGVDYILDKNAGASCTSVREEMALVLKIALICTSRNPADRPSMRDVVSMLQEAKPQRKLASGDSVGSGVVDRHDHVIHIDGGGVGDCSSSLEGKIQ